MNLSTSSIIESIDSKVDMPVKRDEKIEEVVRNYLEHPCVPLDTVYHDKLHNHYVLLTVPVLTPSEIDIAFQNLLRIPGRNVAEPSMYASALIQKSYHAGNNGFMLHTQNIPSYLTCAWLEGWKNNLIDITIYGDTGDCTGRDSRWCSVRHEGNAGGYFFSSTKDVKIFMSGMTGSVPLWNAETLFRTTNDAMFDHAKRCISGYSFAGNSHLELADIKGNILKTHPEQGKEAP